MTFVSAQERQALIDVLGLDLSRLDLRARAAIEALSEEILALRADGERLRDALREAALLADHDALCPVYNRRAFEREVRREIAVAARFARPMSLVFLDLDDFKHVNDTFGHAAGDDVLVRISLLLQKATREIDIVGRLGGDEFGIIMLQADLAASQQKADQIATEVDNFVVSDGETLCGIKIGVSCGVAEWRPGEPAEKLIARADQDMYVQKSRRKA